MFSNKNKQQVIRLENDVRCINGMPEEVKRLMTGGKCLEEQDLEAVVKLSKFSKNRFILTNLFSSNYLIF
jgi:hypothetical protein